MTELAIPATPQLNAPAQLVAWAGAATAAHSLAEGLCRTDFVPQHFRSNALSAAAAILYGAEAGLSPTQALQGIFVIGGKPAMYARTMLAITLSRGHKVWTEDVTGTRVVVCGQRRGQSNVERVVWDIDRARKAGYTKNAKYGSDPQAMLLARAYADVCRRIAPDALLGMAYSVEELQDSGDQAPMGTAAQLRTVQRKVRAEVMRAEPELDSLAEDRIGGRTSLPAPSPTTDRAANNDGPPLDDECLLGDHLAGGHGHIPGKKDEPTLQTPPQSHHDRVQLVPPVIETGEAITDRQKKMLMALLNGQGIKEHDARMAWLAGVVGREVESTNDLTVTEASAAIDALKEGKG